MSYENQNFVEGVNVSNVKALAAFIRERVEFEFHMGATFPPKKSTRFKCGTPGCIAGYAALLWPECREPGGGSFDEDVVGATLGLTDQQVDELFYPADHKDRCVKYANFADSNEPLRYEILTRAGALATLDRLALTGEVKWYLKEQV